MKLFMYTTAFLGMVVTSMVQAAASEESGEASKPSSRVGGSSLAGAPMEELLAEIKRREAAEKAEEGAARKAIAELEERATRIEVHAQEEYDAIIRTVERLTDPEDQDEYTILAKERFATEQTKAEKLRAEAKKIARAQAEEEGAARGGSEGIGVKQAASGAGEEGEGGASAASASSAGEAEEESDDALVARLTEMLAGVEELEKRSASAQGEAVAAEERYKDERKGFFSSSPDTEETAALKSVAQEKRSRAQHLEREARRIRDQVQAEAKRVEKKVSREWHRLKGQAKAEAAKAEGGGTTLEKLVRRALTGGDAKKVEKKARETGKKLEKEVRRLFGRF